VNELVHVFCNAHFGVKLLTEAPRILRTVLTFNGSTLAVIGGFWLMDAEKCDMGAVTSSEEDK